MYNVITIVQNVKIEYIHKEERIKQKESKQKEQTREQELTRESANSSYEKVGGNAAIHVGKLVICRNFGTNRNSELYYSYEEDNFGK